MFMLLGLHSIWESRVATRHADINAREASEHFRGNMDVLLDEVHKAWECVPEWIPYVEPLLAIKRS